MKSKLVNAIVSAAKIIKVATLFKNANAVLPAMYSTAFMDDHLEWTNLETSVTVPYKTGIKTFVDNALFIAALKAIPEPNFTYNPKNLKLTISEGKQSIILGGNSLDNFPKTLKGFPVIVGAITADLIPVLKTSILFQSNDDLRPSMTYTQVHTHIVATDAHKLLFVKLDNPLKQDIYLQRKTIALMEIFGGEWEVQVLTEKGLDGKTANNAIRLTNINDVRITQRYPDFTYPQWQTVIPKITKDSPVATINKKELQTAIKAGLMFANRSTAQGILKFAGKSTWSAADIDFESEYSTEIKTQHSEELSIAFNGKLLLQVLNSLPDGDFKMNYWHQDKAVIFNDHILLMPLHLHS